MALQKTTKTRGITVPDGYWKINKITLGDNKLASARLSLFANKELADDEEESYVFKTIIVNFSYDLDGPNIFVQGYNAVKALDEFQEAIDIFEEGQP